MHNYWLMGLLSGILAAFSAFAGPNEIPPGEDVLANPISQLQPGDELVLQGGTYNQTQRFSITVNGTPDQPIIIRAKQGESAIITMSANQNLIDIENSTHLIFRNLEFKGGDRGIRLTNSNFITIEQCHIHSTGDAAITANDPGDSYQGLKILRNHIHDAGAEGVYFGCNRDEQQPANECQIFNSLIENNHIHDTGLFSGANQGDGIEIKHGSYNNIVRENVVYDNRGPSILVDDTDNNGDRNIIERNVVWGSQDNAIQVGGDVIVRNNIVLGASFYGINVLPHQADNNLSRNVQIAHNTIIAQFDENCADGSCQPNSAIFINAPSESIIIANNALFAENSPALLIDLTSGGNIDAVDFIGNIGIDGVRIDPEDTTATAPSLDAVGNINTDLVAADFSGVPPQNVFPANDAKLIGAAVNQHLVDDDFNGTPRAGQADVGAYKWRQQGNPGWIIKPDFKALLLHFSDFEADN